VVAALGLLLGLLFLVGHGVCVLLCLSSRCLFQTVLFNRVGVALDGVGTNWRSGTRPTSFPSAALI
jgi:hypothetical protein